MFGLSRDDFIQDKQDYRLWHIGAWEKGNIYIGSVTYDSARYVVQYIDKAHNGELAKEVYGDRQVPFRLVSAGIGRRWAEEHESLIRDKGYMTVRGVKVGLPRYYRNLLEIEPDIDGAKEHEIDLDAYYRRWLSDPQTLLDLSRGPYEAEDTVIDAIRKRSLNQAERNAFVRIDMSHRQKM